LEPALRKTLGVPLFQEQLMQMAIDVAGFDAAAADQLRRAMGSKRSEERMARLKHRLYTGMAKNGITGDLADEIYTKLSAFANFGFPESHALSFAYLVYASSWLKLYYPAAFCAALLNAQPMGFYSPNSLVADARRNGVVVRRPDINVSGAKATLEPVDPACGSPVSQGGHSAVFCGDDGREYGYGDCGDASPPAVRLGLCSVRHVSEELAERIEAQRAADGPYRDLADLARRVGVTPAQMEALATADAFAGFGLTRREALWLAGAAAQERADRLPGTSEVPRAPVLPGMADVERAAADVWATGLSPDSHPVQFARGRLDAAGAVSIADLAKVRTATRVLVGGVVTHRQRPATAGGVTFLSLEDETGMLNVVCSEGLWHRYRRVARTSGALLVRGRLERAEGVTNLVAERLESLNLSIRTISRDFR
jgi:error-prone DNA polymerase